MHGFKASQRTRKAWVTRHRNEVWRRPTGEAIKLQGFSPQQRNQIRPVLNRMDTTHPYTELRLRRISLAKRGELERRYKVAYGRRASVGGLTTTPRLVGRSKIDLNPKAFNNRSKWDVQGVLTHELGHALHESAYRDRGYRKEFKRDFAVPRKGKTRALTSPSEHFAETFRVYHAYPMTKREHKYFKHTINEAHIGHIQRHYR